MYRIQNIHKNKIQYALSLFNTHAIHISLCEQDKHNAFIMMCVLFQNSSLVAQYVNLIDMVWYILVQQYQHNPNQI